MCGRYDEPALAREVLDNLKTMCPPPAGCPSLDYLRTAFKNVNYIEGALVKQLQWGTCFAEVGLYKLHSVSTLSFKAPCDPTPDPEMCMPDLSGLYLR
jgi:hypothetical protein